MPLIGSMSSDELFLTNQQVTLKGLTHYQVQMTAPAFKIAILRNRKKNQNLKIKNK